MAEDKPVLASDSEHCCAWPCAAEWVATSDWSSVRYRSLWGGVLVLRAPWIYRIDHFSFFPLSFLTTASRVVYFHKKTIIYKNFETEYSYVLWHVQSGVLIATYASFEFTVDEIAKKLPGKVISWIAINWESQWRMTVGGEAQSGQKFTASSIHSKNWAHLSVDGKTFTISEP